MLSIKYWRGLVDDLAYYGGSSALVEEQWRKKAGNLFYAGNFLQSFKDSLTESG